MIEVQGVHRAELGPGPECSWRNCSRQSHRCHPACLSSPSPDGFSPSHGIPYFGGCWELLFGIQPHRKAVCCLLLQFGSILSFLFSLVFSAHQSPAFAWDIFLPIYPRFQGKLLHVNILFSLLFLSSKKCALL